MLEEESLKNKESLHAFTAQGQFHSMVRNRYTLYIVQTLWLYIANK